MSSTGHDTPEYSPSPPVVSSNFNSPLQPSTILPNALPEPTYTPPDPTKKSHARKQPKGHVPRPRNAFILFRCDFVRQKKVPEDVENDHRNISRIAGRIWREMSSIEKSPWVEMAEKEKTLHQQAYPGYRYGPSNTTPLQTTSRRKKRGDPDDTKPASNVQDIDVPRRRSSSCPPPGAKPILSGHAQYGALSMSKTQDDSAARRPSRVVMYHSTSSSPDPGRTEPTPPQNATLTFPWLKGPMGPPLTTGPYNVALPVDAPGWDSAPPQPREWSEWSDFNIYPSLEFNYDLYSTDPFDSDMTNAMPPPLFTDPFTLSATGSQTSNSPSTATLSPLDPPGSYSDPGSGGVCPFNGSSHYLGTVYDPSANLVGHAPQIYQGEADITNAFPRISLEDIPNISRLNQMSKHDEFDYSR